MHQQEQPPKESQPQRSLVESHGKTLLEVSRGGENEEETSVRKVEKGVREESENSREIVKREGVDVYLGIMPHLNGNTPL